MFYEFAQNAKKRTPRLKDIDVAGMSIILTIKSNSGLSKWQATVDFSDFGHLTGQYWIKADDDQSIIPEHFAKLMQEQILKAFNQ